MNVRFVLVGTLPNSSRPFHYRCLADSGVAREIRDECFVPSGTILDLPDDQWSAQSGWIHWQCDHCGIQFWTLGSPGGKITCPSCEIVDTIPMEAEVSEDEDDA